LVSDEEGETVHVGDQHHGMKVLAQSLENHSHLGEGLARAGVLLGAVVAPQQQHHELAKIFSS
jgi:hypothetical protein